MANTFVTAKQIAELAAVAYYQQSILPNLVYRDIETSFKAAKVGDTVEILKPASFIAKDFKTEIELQDINETTMQVKVDKIKDVSFAISSKDAALTVDQIGRRYVAPAMQAIGTSVEADLVTAIKGLSGVATVAGADDLTVLADARQKLNKASVPMSERYALVGSGIAASWLKDDKLRDASQAGDTLALRQGSLGRSVYGFEPFESNALADTEGAAFHKSAVAFTSVPLDVPAGVQEAYVATYNGFSVRVVGDYEVRTKQWIWSIDTLYGATGLFPDRAVLLKAGKAQG